MPCFRTCRCLPLLVVLACASSPAGDTAPAPAPRDPGATSGPDSTRAAQTVSAEWLGAERRLATEIVTRLHRSSPSPGDLLFFGRPATDAGPERVVHAGRWIGEGRFIHSSGRVRISSMDPADPLYDAYNRGRYPRTKRVLGHPEGVHFLAEGGQYPAGERFAPSATAGPAVREAGARPEPEREGAPPDARRRDGLEQDGARRDAHWRDGARWDGP